MSGRDLQRCIRQLAARDPTFAAASGLADPSDRAWQSATFLLTADRELWSHFGPAVTRTRTLSAVGDEALALYGYASDGSRSGDVQPSRYWRQTQTDLLVWASFCWTDQWFDGPTAVPRALSTRLFERWLSALWIQRDHDQRHGLLST